MTEGEGRAGSGWVRPSRGRKRVRPSDMQRHSGHAGERTHDKQLQAETGVRSYNTQPRGNGVGSHDKMPGSDGRVDNGLMAAEKVENVCESGGNMSEKVWRERVVQLRSEAAKCGKMPHLNGYAYNLLRCSPRQGRRRGETT
jgi:hypothetical protein